MYVNNNLEKMNINELKFNDKEQLNKMVNSFVNYIYYQMRKENKPLFGDINFDICGNRIIYNTEKKMLKKADIDNYIEVGNGTIYTESDLFSITIPYYDQKMENIMTYKKEIREMDSEILESYVIKTEDKELTDLLYENDFTFDEDNNEYYLELEKDLFSEDLINEMSTEFLNSEIYSYIRKKYIKGAIKDNNLFKIKEFAREKELLLMVYKKMIKKFLPKAKTKGLNVKNNK